MEKTTVRLTVQLRDHDNRKRYTQHHDVPLSKAGECAGEVASEMSRAFRRAHRQDQGQGESK